MRHSFTAVTRVQIPSGTPNLFKNLESAGSFAQAQKGTSETIIRSRCLATSMFVKAYRYWFVGTKGTLQASGSHVLCFPRTDQPDDITFSFALLLPDPLRLGFHPAP